MAVKTKLPIGIEDFEEIRTLGYYYIDKTGLIRELLENPGKVNLITCPRRFGKTLNMSTLEYFFEIGSDSTLFDGLEISEQKELCNGYMEHSAHDGVSDSMRRTGRWNDGACYSRQRNRLDI